MLLGRLEVLIRYIQFIYKIATILKIESYLITTKLIIYFRGELQNDILKSLYDVYMQSRVRHETLQLMDVFNFQLIVFISMSQSIDMRSQIFTITSIVKMQFH